jgi:signal peptidase II
LGASSQFRDGNVRVLVLSGLIVLTDQVTKILIKGIHLPALGLRLEGMTYGESKPVLGDLFRLTYIENPGMAFGIDVGGKLFFSVFSLVASVAILMYLFHVRTSPLPFRVALAMILGGAVGNLIDRVFYGVLYGDAPLFFGKVVDFFDLDFFDISVGAYNLTRWPVFNVADASVTLGVLLILLVQRTAKEHEGVEARPAEAEPDDRRGTTPAA